MDWKDIDKAVKDKSIYNADLPTLLSYRHELDRLATVSEPLFEKFRDSTLGLVRDLIAKREAMEAETISIAAARQMHAEGIEVKREAIGVNREAVKASKEANTIARGANRVAKLALVVALGALALQIGQWLQKNGANPHANSQSASQPSPPLPAQSNTVSFQLTNSTPATDTNLPLTNKP